MRNHNVVTGALVILPLVLAEVHFGNTSRRENGESQTRSAPVSGTLIGLALPLPDGTNDGSIGTGQREIIIRDR